MELVRPSDTALRAAAGLSVHQRELLDEWLPAAIVTHDRSSGLKASVVFEVATDEGGFVVKAGKDADRSVRREIRAHQQWTSPWTANGLAPRLEYADVGAKLLVTGYLDGDPILDTPHEDDPVIHQQAGAMLRELHAQYASVDSDWEANENAMVAERLDHPHRIAPDVVARLRELLETLETSPVMVVPTHGDWQPRNWILREGRVAGIDFGRAMLRPVWTDFWFLYTKYFSRDRRLEEAFLDGYGSDPRQEAGWFGASVREAIGPAAWGFQIQHEEYEQLGHDLIAEVLGESRGRFS